MYRPTEGLVFTSRLEDTTKAFKDAKTFSSVGDMRAPGVTVPDEECFLGEIDAPLHPKIRRLLLPGFTPDAANRAEGLDPRQHPSTAAGHRRPAHRRSDG